MLTITVPDELPLAEAASFLGISVATLRNWLRLGHVRSCGGRPLAFRTDELRRLARRIAVGEFPRLRARANKTACPRSAKAYAADPRLARISARLGRLAVEGGYSATALLYLAAWRMLTAAGEAAGRVVGVPSCTATWRRHGVAAIMGKWRSRIIRRFRDDEIRLLADLAELPVAVGFDERLGALRHALSPAGRKARQGAFNTPLAQVAPALAALPGGGGAFLDPCCGDGRFLVLAGRELGLEPEELIGYDIDPDAVAIAGLNLLMAYPDRDFTPHLHCLDFVNTPADALPDVPAGGFAAIATNPPWGGRARRPALPAAAGGRKPSSCLSTTAWTCYARTANYPTSCRNRPSPPPATRRSASACAPSPPCVVSPGWAGPSRASSLRPSASTWSSAGRRRRPGWSWRGRAGCAWSSSAGSPRSPVA